MAVLTDDQAHHLRAVLRLREGEEVELFDGEGCSYSGKIRCHGGEIHVEALKELETRRPRRAALVLAAALIRADRFEWMLEKATELGVDRIIPLETRFSTVRIPPTRLEAKMERWQRIVREASKQCGRLTVPQVQMPLAYSTLPAAAEYAKSARFLLHEKATERLRPTFPSANPILLCVGPEGGWDASEVSAAQQAGWRVVCMGSAILRAETACLAAVAVLRFLLDE